MQLKLFEDYFEKKLLEDLFKAYFDARKNKRNTINALAFEKNFEENLFKLFDDIITGMYEPKPSICFIVNKPVKREIFAADFRDRIVHHLIYNYISPIFEKLFINDSYSCRKGKGTHYGINRVDHFIRSCSRNYTRECYILKLDIKGYFMSINRTKLYDKIESILVAKKHKIDYDLALILVLIKKTIFNDPTVNCKIKGNQTDWNNLPHTKSLFSTTSGCGLPIGNLTSQLFGNIYLNDFDHFVKRDLKIKYYGRYVDDFVIIHQKKGYLTTIIENIKSQLKDELDLTLHPNKIYLQHFSKGVKYLGVIIKPHRKYIANSTSGNFFNAIQKQNEIVNHHEPNQEEIDNFVASMNSYLGILQHYKTYKLRKKILWKNLSGWWWKYVYMSDNYKKFKKVVS